MILLNFILNTSLEIAKPSYAYNLKINRLHKLLLLVFTKANYYFNKLQFYTINGIKIIKWHMVDELVNKVLAIYLQLKCKNLFNAVCVSHKGHGGIRACAFKVGNTASKSKFVYKTDIRSYYSSINHEILLNNINCYYPLNKNINELLKKHLQNVAKYTTGITRGSALSFVFAGIYLHKLDEYFSDLKQLGYDIEYIRYVDDIIIFSSDLNILEQAKKELLNIITSLDLTIRPEKTYFGLIKNGFDFVGFKYNQHGMIGLADKTKNKFENNFKNHAMFNEQGIYHNHFNTWVKGATANKKHTENIKAQTRVIAKNIEHKTFAKYKTCKHKIKVFNFLMWLNHKKNNLAASLAKKLFNKYITSSHSLAKYNKLIKFRAYKKSYNQRKRQKYLDLIMNYEMYLSGYLPLLQSGKCLESYKET